MSTDRRAFLAGASGALVACATLDWRKLAHAAAQAEQAAGSPDPALTVLSKTQAATIDAIASRIVPTDDLPGAHEAGIVYFIDQALGSFFASAREDFLAKLADFDTDVAIAHDGLAFTALDVTTQDDYLRRIDTTAFFDLVRSWTIIGLLASPKYGGNRHLVGWKLAGFEDAHRYEPPFGFYDRDYEGFEPYPPEDGS